MAQPVVVALVCSTLVFIHFGNRWGQLKQKLLLEKPSLYFKLNQDIFT